MADCWKPLPEDRPKFADLVTKVDSIVTSLAGYLDFTALDTRM